MYREIVNRLHLESVDHLVSNHLFPPISLLYYFPGLSSLRKRPIFVGVSNVVTNELLLLLLLLLV